MRRAFKPPVTDWSAKTLLAKDILAGHREVRGIWRTRCDNPWCRRATWPCPEAEWAQEHQAIATWVALKEAQQEREPVRRPRPHPYRGTAPIPGGA